MKQDQRQRIQWAYAIAKMWHDGQTRDMTGERYFEHVRGVVFSDMDGCMEGDKRSLLRYLRRTFRDAPFPVLQGFPSGHGIENITLPIGVRASLSSDPPRLLIEEGAVR